MSEEADAYYRQMAYNYREALEKAKVDEISLESQEKVLASTGDFRQYKRTKRELDSVKRFEKKCEREAERFKKAAEWTEAHFHVTRPPIPDGPPGMGGPVDQEVMQASGSKAP